MNRIGLKISCLVVAIVIWVQVAATSLVEQEAALPLRLTGLPEGVTAAGSEIPTQVRVRMEGSKLRLLAHGYFNRYIGEVRVNVSDRLVGPTFSYELDQNDVFTDLVVVGIQPPVRLRIKLDREVRRMLPVQMATTGVLPGNVDYLVRPIVMPDSVLVTGPERFFPPSGAVMTEPLAEDRLQESGETELQLVRPHEALQMAGREVRVRYQLAQVIERTVPNVPVIPLVDAGRPEVGVSPPVADVMVRGIADSVLAVQADRIVVTVPVGSLAAGVHVVAGQASLPPHLTLIALDPPEFRIVVGRKPAAQPDSLRARATARRE